MLRMLGRRGRPAAGFTGESSGLEVTPASRDMVAWDDSSVHTLLVYMSTLAASWVRRWTMLRLKV